MDSTELGDLWDRVSGIQPAPEQWLVVVTATAALVAVVPNLIWRLSRNAVTIAHEGGHGLVALLTGRQLSGIRLHSDTSGLTVSRGKPTGVGMILTAAAGYTAPPLLGLGGAWLLTRFTRAELNEGLLWRDLFGVGIAAGVGFTVSLLVSELAFVGTDQEQSKTAVLLASVIAGLAAALVLGRRNRQHQEA